MVDDLESREARSSNELWSEICPGLASQQPQGQEAEEFTDSFQPPLEETGLGSGQYSVPLNPPLNPWAPMADSDVYIASLGTIQSGCFTLCFTFDMSPQMSDLYIYSQVPFLSPRKPVKENQGPVSGSDIAGDASHPITGEKGMLG